MTEATVKQPSDLLKEKIDLFNKISSRLQEVESERTNLLNLAVETKGAIAVLQQLVPELSKTE